MAEIHELRRARKRQPLPIPTSACVIWDTLGLPGPKRGHAAKFLLRTRRCGTEIWFTVPTPTGAFQWNVSALNNYWPHTFGEARKWVKAYAAGFGQDIEEVVKPRMVRAVGMDRKLMRAGGCKEVWLKSDIPELWATAMVRCQHPGAFCGSDGYCHYGTCSMEMEPEPPCEEDDEE